MSERRVRTTVAISADLLEAVDVAIRQGAVENRNEFLETALRNELSALRRAAIDAAFAKMASDRVYQREAAETAEEFAFADWEALRLSEGGS
jgi:metal-responsive CopG/Arc/MetJ family transcriptional regulator